MKEFQERVKEFVEENNLETSPECHLLDLISELGEVSKEILKSTSYGRSKKRTQRREISEELGDAFYSLINLSNELNVDLEQELNKVLKKYEKRLKKGGPGSENE